MGKPGGGLRFIIFHWSEHRLLLLRPACYWKCSVTFHLLYHSSVFISFVFCQMAQPITIITLRNTEVTQKSPHFSCLSDDKIHKAQCAKNIQN